MQFPEGSYIKTTMPTEKPTVTFVADENLIRRINDYRFTERIENKSEAIRRLLEKALDLYEKKSNKNL